MENDLCCGIYTRINLQDLISLTSQIFIEQQQKLLVAQILFKWCFAFLVTAQVLWKQTPK